MRSIKEIRLPAPTWNHLQKTGCWSDFALAQARLRAGMGIVKLIQVVVGSLGLLTFGYH